jgi:hypothetical protein
MSLYAWREVVSWIREVIGIDPDEDIEYLDDAQIASLNVELAAHPTTSGWHQMSVDAEWIIADVQRMCATEASPGEARVQLTTHRGGELPHEQPLKLRVAVQ